ncbi:bifunctional D-glycero-beta-D-manno-heptose-7-phosphate kinase/D-glycero-beta-D-manno-heptose 1-phosphate adenylyltransferase HldE [Geomonas sp.]|uniref:bifunctional D-glycero-beta-D-manno-heptose-7-phosphate kinase/D-glycero-beta-D-manno-heptose 1-phosphate adenylyltransferase HldE n=1 Tax=Geomonas sp. TaxID=2651584 RepID=UPI002B495557|nr:bifunctional D-glycero-beta-D-manno-heptose-7-phosphate kinase/D-glycero-beta-D-manno-heptose 1-phosphate adenylyltransferase HldE [Geomonas sp.]HJV34875.1 bifunctional D-glycero-beta-D-manno-heptose-7-phosphate kinase/D-glycero-beta-D-manno-heptose 1-phosphate adenylyltransferase HldE [Geomonas sp.]
MERREVESFLEKAASVRALVIGDLMLDEYLWGRAERISPEAPVQVVEVARDDLRLGGAGNVVNNLVALGCTVSVCSVIGADDNGLTLRNAFAEKGIDLEGLFEDPERRTSKKTRVIAANQQIVRIDRETKSAIGAGSEQEMIHYILSCCGNFDVIIVSDYLKGVLTPQVLATVCKAGRALGIPVVVDPKGSDYKKYTGATLLTPNRKEAEIASGIAIGDLESLEQAADRLLSELELDALLITRSEAGMSLFHAQGGGVHIPTVAREVFDVTGAGDTVISVLSLGLACGLPMEDAAWVANVAAGIAVGKLGTSTVSPQEIVAEVGHSLKDSDSKIKNLDVLAHQVAIERCRGKKVVFTNGCFDLLHVGHVKYLQKARQLGDMLVVGLNSDASVRRLKGEKRPLIEQSERAHILAALDCIDFVVIFDEDTPLKVIEAVRPDVLVKGGDYSLDGVVGREVVEANGGKVELVQFVDGRSTSRIIEKILSSY